MSYSLDVNLLLYASDASSRHPAAAGFQGKSFPQGEGPSRRRSRTASGHEVFSTPLHPRTAWDNVQRLIGLPRATLIGEEDEFAQHYANTMAELAVRGNLVPDAHLATILRQHGVTTIYTNDADFRKFEFLQAINPLGTNTSP